MEAMEKIKSTANDIRSTANEIRDRVSPQLAAAKERVSVFSDQVIEVVKAHPGKSLLGALALGLVVGRFVSRGNDHGSA
jgi:ElaB/YqjD/DUF883 family membrane-anchored ribosome-binding protein